MASTHQTFQCLLNSQQWVGILLHVGVKMVEVCVKVQAPILLWTSTTALHHAFWLGQIMSESNISQKCAWTSATNCGGICLNDSLNGTSSVTLIICLIEWVQPSSLDSREKMSWYSAKRDWAELTSSGGQDSNPLKYIFSNNFSCLCPMVSLCGWLPQALCNASIIPGLICGSQHPTGGYYPCHQNLPPQGLRVCHAVSHYNTDTLAAAAHCCVSILYCQTLGQWSLISTKGLGHHIQPCTCECGLCPCVYDSGQEGNNHLTVLGGNYFITFHRVQYLSGNLVIPYHGSSLPHCQERGYSGIDPRGCQGIYLSIPYHIHDAAYHGGSQDHRDPCHKVGQIWD